MEKTKKAILSLAEICGQAYNIKERAYIVKN